ncbi:MAG TPA: ATP-binding cassette domain-containing protein [Thermoleophilia bacterium]|nr:ATP-binding cassette domain-containing protein [Thermoleophilia bacterium]
MVPEAALGVPDPPPPGRLYLDKETGLLLNLEDVSKAFKGLMAVHSVSTHVAEGEILGLIGPNGAGKTTLFNLITGVYPATKGKIFFEDKDISSIPPHSRCWLGIARTFQLVRPLPELSVLDNAAIGRVYGRDPIKSRSRAEKESIEFLEVVGLAQRSSEKAKGLTLVDRKRLELARALAAKPKLLLLDELLAGLNPSEVLAAMELIKGIRDKGVTIVMVEHLVKAVFGIADRIVVLNAGELIAEGTPAEVSCDQNVIDAYLGKSWRV